LTTAVADTRSTRVPPRERSGSESLLDVARSIVHELPALVGDRVELLSLELQRAGDALVKMTVLAAAAAILALTAWLALWGVLVGLLVALGWPEAGAHLMVVLINAAAAAWLLWRARGLFKLLGLPATRRHLMVGLHERPVGSPSPQDATDEQRAAAGSAAAT
jgi:uncharacterized membrane protein YqjE